MNQDNRFQTRLILFLVAWMLGWLWFGADYFVALFTWPDGSPGMRCADALGSDPQTIATCRKLVGTAESYYWSMQAVKNQAFNFLMTMMGVPLVVLLVWRAKKWIYD